MSGPRPSRWLPAIVLFAALPAAPQAQSAFTEADTRAENSETASASGDISFADRAPEPKPQLTPEEMGDLLEVREHYQAAIESYAKIQQPSAKVWNKMGIAYQMMFDLKDALRCYNESLKLDPSYFNVLNNLATVQDSMKDFPAGERTYRKALKLQPDSTVILKNLGTNLLMQHEYEKGAKVYKQALAIAPHIFDETLGPSINDPAPTQERGAANYFKARSCARAGLDDCALAFLHKAFCEGFATAKKVKEEADFAKLRGTPALQRLLANQR